MSSQLWFEWYCHAVRLGVSPTVIWRNVGVQELVARAQFVT